MKRFMLALTFFSILCFGQANNSPNMKLPIPIPGVTSGPMWAQDINASLTLIDQHDHTPGYGVQITPAGVNINTNLAFNNNASTNMQASVYTPQGSYSTNYGVHVEGADLYFVDGNGTDIRMTSGGTVNATSNGISSGTATASFSAGVLIVNSASNTPANIQAASYLMGNNVANSKYLTLQPPNAMAANYSITFPPSPASQSFLALDTFGIISSYAPIAAGLTGSNIAASTITSTNMAANSIVTAAITDANVTRAKLVSVGQQISSSCGTFSTVSTSAVDVTNLSISITTTGRPVFIMLVPDGTASVSWLDATAGGTITVNRAGSDIAQIKMGSSGAQVPVSAVLYLDPVAAGTYTYKIRAFRVGGTSSAPVTVNNAKLVAYEL